MSSIRRCGHKVSLTCIISEVAMRNYYFFCGGCVKTLGLVTSKRVVGAGHCCSCCRPAEVFAFETAIALRAGNDFVKRIRMDYIRLLITEGVLRKFGNAMKKLFTPQPVPGIETRINAICNGKPGNAAFLGSSAYAALARRDRSVGLAHVKWSTSVPAKHCIIFSQILAAKTKGDSCPPFILWLHIK